MSLQYALTQRCIDPATNNDTAKTTRRACAAFAEWCKSQGITKIKKIESAGPQRIIQQYADYLVSKPYSPATVHTYLAGPCKALSVPMAQISKPKRSASSITRSRDKSRNIEGHIQQTQDRYARLVAFQSAAGIRRNELTHLKGRDLVHDESGYICVRVARGKGGKCQLQRILPADLDTVIATFSDIGPDDYVFASTELRNKIDLHALRASHARDAYKYYCGLFGQDRQNLLSELCTRWLQAHPWSSRNSPDCKRWYAQMTRGGGLYRLRGENYDRAVISGRPTTYDRVALMAVSVFHLSHWRLDVTVKNYMI